MNRISGLILILSLMLIFAGCGGARIINIDKSHLITKQFSKNQVEEAIKRAAVRRGWRIKKVADNLLEATIQVRKHTVVINIPYDNHGYRINYVKSKNLNYNSQTNTIHKSYNRWVKNLVYDIDNQLSLLDENDYEEGIKENESKKLQKEVSIQDDEKEKESEEFHLIN